MNQFDFVIKGFAYGEFPVERGLVEFAQNDFFLEVVRLTRKNSTRLGQSL